MNGWWIAPCVQHYTTINKILINLRPGLRYHQASTRHINIIIYTFIHSIKSTTFSLHSVFIFAYFMSFQWFHKTLYSPEVFMMRPAQTSGDWDPDFQDQENFRDTEPAFRDILYNLLVLYNRKSRDKQSSDILLPFMWFHLSNIKLQKCTWY